VLVDCNRLELMYSNESDRLFEFSDQYAFVDSSSEMEAGENK